MTYGCRKVVDKEAIDLEILDTVNKVLYYVISFNIVTFEIQEVTSIVNCHLFYSLIQFFSYPLWECVGPAANSLESSIKWGDGFLIMYSVTDRSSFESVSRLKRLIDHGKQTLGN